MNIKIGIQNQLNNYYIYVNIKKVLIGNNYKPWLVWVIYN